ncbi:Hypothetical predicted protein [Pelobates cultripes]|uniref:Uncharacterized protein n=1 Tax=Pelobates cultripes TaxID=61616 RepID=A0AAD1TIA0_PELCU|nr:Hypothetical predicted protein [Pelobates cultripes]
MPQHKPTAWTIWEQNHEYKHMTESAPGSGPSRHANAMPWDQQVQGRPTQSKSQRKHPKRTSRNFLKAKGVPQVRQPKQYRRQPNMPLYGSSTARNSGWHRTQVQVVPSEGPRSERSAAITGRTHKP